MQSKCQGLVLALFLLANGPAAAFILLPRHAVLGRSVTAAVSSEYQGLTVPELKERCRDLDLRVGGTKADLIDRLQEQAGAGAPAGSPEEVAAAHAPTAAVAVAGVPNCVDHPYSRDPTDTASVLGMEASELHGLLARRDQARREADWALSDDIRAKLRARGVSMDDKTFLWRADWNTRPKHPYKQVRRSRKG